MLVASNQGGKLKQWQAAVLCTKDHSPRLYSLHSLGVHRSGPAASQVSSIAVVPESSCQIVCGGFLT